MADDQNTNEIQFAIQRLYLKDVSFESPNSPTIFQKQWQPQVNLDLNTSNEKLSENQHEVVLSLTVTAKVDEQVAFIIEVQQAGVFFLQGLTDEQLGHTLGAYCPNVLFPYAREVIDALAVKGSYPALMLQPVNFDALYAQALEQQQQEGEGKTH